MPKPQTNNTTQQITSTRKRKTVISHPATKRTRKLSIVSTSETNNAVTPFVDNPLPIAPDLAAKLNRWGISENTYQQARSTLLALEYNDTQINQIVVRKYHSNSLNTLIKFHEQLINKKVNHAQITCMVKEDGGGRNLQAFLDYCDTLLQNPYSLTIEDMVKIASYKGGSHNLESVARLAEELIKLGYSINDIIRMAAHSGGSCALGQVKKLTEELKAFGYLIEDIRKIAAHNGGSRNLEKVKQLTEELKTLGYLIEDIRKMAAHNGGSRNLEQVIKLTEELKALGYVIEYIRKMAAHIGGSHTLAQVKKLTVNLKALGYSIEDIREMAAHGGGSRTLEHVKRLTEELKTLGYSITDIRLMASYDGGSHNLKTIIIHATYLKDHQIPVGDILSMVNQKSGGLNLHAFVYLMEHGKKENGEKLDNDDIAFLIHHLTKGIIGRNKVYQHFLPKADATSTSIDNLENLLFTDNTENWLVYTDQLYNDMFQNLASLDSSTTNINEENIFMAQTSPQYAPPPHSPTDANNRYRFHCHLPDLFAFEETPYSPPLNEFN